MTIPWCCLFCCRQSQVEHKKVKKKLFVLTNCQLFSGSLPLAREGQWIVDNACGGELVHGTARYDMACFIRSI